jgi:hypothetical protein
MNSKIENFRFVGSSGLVVLRDAWVEWVLEHQNLPGYSQENGYGLGSVTKLAWEVDGKICEVPSEKWPYAVVLPDASGFIAFEEGWKPDNCLLLDAYGQERMRLTVPRHLTGGLVDSSYETGEAAFVNVSEPYKNPLTGVVGKFGVTAYVEGGKFYFELDYHTGEFLWCRQIRD